MDPVGLLFMGITIILILAAIIIPQIQRQMNKGE
jgi:type II secretory pathway pseudopilin PulG